MARMSFSSLKLGAMDLLRDGGIGTWFLMLAFVVLVLATPGADLLDIEDRDGSPQTEVYPQAPSRQNEKRDDSIPPTLHADTTIHIGGLHAGPHRPPHASADVEDADHDHDHDHHHRRYHSPRRRPVSPLPRLAKRFNSRSLHSTQEELQDAVDHLRQLARHMAEENTTGGRLDPQDIKDAGNMTRRVRKISEEMARALEREYEEDSPDKALLEKSKLEIRIANAQMVKVERLLER